MRRHNNKGNGFYKIAKTIPKYMSIEAVIMKAAQNSLEKASTPSTDTGLGSGTPVAPGAVSQGGLSQPAAEPTASSTSAGSLPESEGASATGTLSGVQSVKQSPPANIPSVSENGTSAQPGATGPGKKTDVVEAPSREEPPNYLKNLALLVGIPVTIASLASGAIRGFGMSNLIGLGLGAVATVYGFGFLDSILHSKNILPAEIEHLKRREAVKYFQNQQSAEWTVRRIFGADRRLLDFPRGYHAEGISLDKFRELYALSHDYIMDLCSKAGLLQTSLPRIFGYSYTGASPDADMINSLNKGRDLERHATIIVLANLLKQVEKHSKSSEEAANVLKNLVQKVPYSAWGKYLADPITFARILDSESGNLYDNYRVRAYLIKDKSLSEHLREVASHFDFDAQEAQTQ